MKRKLKFRLTSCRDMRQLSVRTFCCCIVIVVLCLSEVDASLNYTEVEKFGNSCPRLDSCAYQRSTGRRQLTTIKERNCACDYLCSEYGDCCIDAPGNEMAKNDNDLKCFDLKQFGGVFMKDSCPDTYDGPEEVRDLCENKEVADQVDPVGAMPVTDALTGLTYKNYYCSMCNEKFDDVVMWTPRLECAVLALFNRSKNITEDYVLQNLQTDGHKWGLYLHEENGSLFFHDCEVDPVMPLVLQSKIRLCKPHLISSCIPTWKDEEVRAMCRSYMGPKFVHGGDGYKNVHCAVCNNINVTHLSCQSAELRDIDIFRHFGSHSFALLLDVNERRGQEVGKIKQCENGKLFDPFYKECRSLVCLPGYVMEGRSCNKKNPVAVGESVVPLGSEMFENNNISYENVEKSVTEAEVVTLDFGNGELDHSYNVSHVFPNSEFANCVLVPLSDGQYIVMPNRTIYVPEYNKFYEPMSYFVADGSILVCPHYALDDESKFMPFAGYTTVVGLGVSMLFLVLHFVVFCLVPHLQNLPGKNLASLCTALFFAYFFFVFGQMESLNLTLCTAVAFLTFYFFQVSFFWMGVMAFDVWRTLKMGATELRVSKGKQLKRFCVYSFFTWVTPLFILIVLAFAEYTDLFPPAYRPGFASSPCWFKQRRSLFVFFATPLFAIILANVILFISSSRMLVMSTQTPVTQQGRSQRRDFRLYLRLALLMGLTWVVGLIACSVDVPFLWYFFVVLNTLQGLFIFLAFSCSSKVLDSLKNKFKISSRPKEFKSSSNSATSGTVLDTKPTTRMV